MNGMIVQSQDAVTVVGGGPVTRRDLSLCMARAPVIVAADGGADRVLAAGLMPSAVIGDFDSISDAALAVIAPGRLFRIAEQDSTDFAKVLRSVDAPFVLALGVTGARVDHGLAVLNALVRHRGCPCLVISGMDVIFHVPHEVTLKLRVGDRFSLFPMGPVSGKSQGLHWPIDEVALAPDGKTGTSNRVSQPVVQVQFDRPGMLVIVPRARLDAAISGLVPKWRGRHYVPHGVRGE